MDNPNRGLGLGCLLHGLNRVEKSCGFVRKHGFTLLSPSAAEMFRIQFIWKTPTAAPLSASIPAPSERRAAVIHKQNISKSLNEIKAPSGRTAVRPSRLQLSRTFLRQLRHSEGLPNPDPSHVRTFHKVDPDQDRSRSLSGTPATAQKDFCGFLKPFSIKQNETSPRCHKKETKKTSLLIKIRFRNRALWLFFYLIQETKNIYGHLNLASLFQVGTFTIYKTVFPLCNYITRFKMFALKSDDPAGWVSRVEIAKQTPHIHFL